MSKKAWIVSGVVAAAAALAVVAVLPAETGWDPTGLGAKLGLTEIADPVGPELERGLARMEEQQVLALSDTPPAPLSGVTDTWEYELGPFESIEFKYTIPEGQPIAFRWEGSGPLAYDMHAHPFDGGEELTESYGVATAQVMQGIYTPAFTGIHGWFWENRSIGTVTVRLVASGAMTHSTVFSAAGPVERALEGAAANPQGSVEGHRMQTGEVEGAAGAE